CVHLDATHQELAALMRSVCGRGFSTLCPEKCLEVGEYLIAETRALGLALNMRLLDNSLQDRMQWEDGEAECDWRHLVHTRIVGKARGERPESRAARVERERRTARELSEQGLGREE